MILNLDKETLKLVLKFENISLIISYIGIILLYINLKFYSISIIYKLGIYVYRIGLVAGISSLFFGIFFNSLRKGLIK